MFVQRTFVSGFLHLYAPFTCKFDYLSFQCPYQLHAVFVHEGQAASGHYWAYIYDTRRQEWLKFNDITVSGASWEDLMKESVGGYHNASAYCLMYVDKSHYDDQGKLYHNASAYCLMYVDKSHYDDQGKLYHNASAYCLMYVDKSHYEDQGKVYCSIQTNLEVISILRSVVKFILAHYLTYKTVALEFGCRLQTTLSSDEYIYFDSA